MNLMQNCIKKGANAMDNENNNLPDKKTHFTYYKNEYDQKLIDHLAAGYSFQSFSGTVGVCRKTIYNWLDEHESFRQAKEIGLSKTLHLFESVLMDKMLGTGETIVNPRLADTASLLFALKTRFKDIYSERVESVQSGEIKINIDQDDSGL